MVLEMSPTSICWVPEGTRSGMRTEPGGRVIHYHMGQRRSTEERFDKLHLNDAMRIRMARMVLDYFEGEVERVNWAGNAQH